MPNKTKFLSLFDPTAGAPAIPVPPPAPPPAPAVAGAPPVNVTVNLLDALGEEVAEAKRRKAAAAAPPPPPPAPPPVVKPAEGNVTVAQFEELKSLLLQSQENERLAKLAEHRQRAIAAGRSVGLDQAFDVYVGGGSPAEIDASLQVALAEQKRFQAQIIQNLQNQHGVNPAPAPAPVAAAPQAPVQNLVPVGFSTAPVAPTAAPAVSAPGYIAPQPPPAPGVAQGYSPEQLAYLTSDAAIRSGEYGQHRDRIMAQLMQTGGARPVGGGTPWSLSQPQQQPTVPLPQAPAPVPQWNGTVTNPSFAGNRQGFSYNQPAGPMPQQPQFQSHQAPPAAPQPNQFQLSVAPGVYVPTGAPNPQDLAAAQQAAAASLRSSGEARSYGFTGGTRFGGTVN